MSTRNVRLGIVGYGLGGRSFHAPYVMAAKGIDLVGIVARSEAKVAQIHQDLPGVPVYPSLTEMLSAGVDAVTITTPPQTRRDLVLEAIAAGVHVVTDKPIATNVESAVEMLTAAQQAGVLLTPFHNRRWDAAYRTMTEAKQRGMIGKPTQWWCRLDLVEGNSVVPGPGGGVLNDLGAHLVDQALALMGPGKEVRAELDHCDAAQLGTGTGSVDGGFHLTIRHANGGLSYLEASKVGWDHEFRMRLKGTAGAVSMHSTDVQVNQVLSGNPPGADRSHWGFEPAGATLSMPDGRENIPSAQGDYADYYERFAAAVREDGPVPVTMEEGIAALAVIVAARDSDASGQWEQPSYSDSIVR